MIQIDSIPTIGGDKKLTTHETRFHAALRAGTAYEVPRNRVQFVPFQQGDGLRGIGTNNPQGGAVVILCSPAGAIVGHIPASPVPMIDIHISMENLRRRMTEVLDVARRYRLCFPPCSFALVVIPTIQGRMALPQHAERIRSMLVLECFDPAITTYSMPVGLHEDGERGIVYVEGSLERFTVYVEGRRIVG